MLNYILLAFCVSIDSFGIGITYGIKNTKISLLAKCILFLFAIIIANLSMFFGQILTALLPNIIVNFLGSAILIFMGIWVIHQCFHNSSAMQEFHLDTSEKVYTFFIKCLGITIQIIKNPISSDFDGSHKIDWKEAIFLGIALSLDLFCVGIGSSIIGVNSIIFPILVATFQLCFLSLGGYLGKRLSSISKIPETTWSIISGILLIGIGISKLFF